MNYDQLLINYQALLEENTALKSEIAKLKQHANPFPSDGQLFHLEAKQLSILETPSMFDIQPTQAPSVSDNQGKIALFMSLFKGREDVYAKRWENKAGKSGYSPYCRNEWRKGVCQKPRMKCSDCSNKNYEPLSDAVIEAHLRGDIIAGIYPMLADETCAFLAIDFDETTWEKDVSALRAVCKELDIPVAVERSRSGKGAHVWIFFESPISSGLARKLGTAILTYAMNRRHEISFNSYDRLFPNQDTMPKGGFGNLIALPLQAIPRKSGNSVFVDELFLPYTDQWTYLGDIQKLSETSINTLVSKLCTGNELGVLKVDTEEDSKPWICSRPTLTKEDFPRRISLVKASMLYIEKQSISQRALNQLKRLSAFRNPDFYKSQALRLPTFNKPRIIACSEETEQYLGLPRGCATDVSDLLGRLNIQITWADETNRGRAIKVEFNGTLRDEQQEAVSELIKHDEGVLAATTAFGKTVVAANLISQKKVNTLILVHRQQLLAQWITRLSQFLNIDEEPTVVEQKRGRKKKLDLIGRLGAGKDQLSGIVDVAIMQSLNYAGVVKDCVKNYGMIIVDECHHVPAFSFEQILKKSNAKFLL